jgi:hypothetical protein
MRMPTVVAPELICDFTVFPLSELPFPHVSTENFIETSYYSQLLESFPTCPPKVGPTGYSLYWGDAAYDQLLASEPAWKKLFNTFHSQAFVNWCAAQFSEVWKRDGCRIDVANARYVPYREDRIDKERPTLRKVEHESHELWVRMDVHQGQIGYDRPIHLDHARRLVSMLIYFADQTENDMQGGELLLYSNKHDSKPVGISPHHNRMIAFPCTARSYHSVPRIIAQRAPRNYIQIHLSSSVDVWPRESVPVWRRTLGKMKRTMKDALSVAAVVPQKSFLPEEVASDQNRAARHGMFVVA